MSRNTPVPVTSDTIQYKGWHINPTHRSANGSGRYCLTVQGYDLTHATVDCNGSPGGWFPSQKRAKAAVDRFLARAGAEAQEAKAVANCLRVLVACESSGTVREAFSRLGHDAWSCDLLPADDADLRHFKADCLAVIRQQPWDLIIAHPPCTHLAVSGARHFAAKKADGRQQQGIDLFLDIVRACEASGAAWAVENPIGIMSSLYRKPDQIIQPWMFGHPETKATCLWLGGGLKPLVATNNVKEQMLALPVAQRNRIHHMPPSKDRWKLRSKTYRGIADAMATQYSAAVVAKATS